MSIALTSQYKIVTQAPPKPCTFDNPLWIERREEQGNASLFAVGEESTDFIYLQGPITARIFDTLLRNQNTEPAYSGININCHGSVNYVLDNHKPCWLTPVPERGERISVEKALADFNLPCRMQLVRDVRDAYHSAILLGSHRDIPLMFHRPGNCPFEICSYDDVLRRYPGPDYVNFHGVNRDENNELIPATGVKTFEDSPEVEFSSDGVAITRILAAVSRLSVRC